MAGEWRDTTLDQVGRIVTGKTPPASVPEYFGGQAIKANLRGLDYDG